MLRAALACDRLDTIVILSEEQRVEAIRLVTGSVAFHRADVLKLLLEYLQAQDALGRAHEVTESEIALKVMGRGERFSPESDSSVRTRFLALRKKLEEFYDTEGSEADLRIDIPRGTYTLRFVRKPAPLPPPSPLLSVEPVEPIQAPKYAFKEFLMGVLAGALALAALVGGWVMLRSGAEFRQNAVLEKAWGPMLRRGAGVTVAVGTPTSFFVRDFGNAEAPIGDPNYRLPVERSAEFEEWYLRARSRPLGKTVIFHPNLHSPLWGDAAAASVVSRLFGAWDVTVERLPSVRIHPVVLRDRNAVVIGRVEYTDAARALTPDDGLMIEYSAKERVVGVHNRKPKPKEPLWWFATQGLRHSYGLITVLGNESGKMHQLVLFSGINSDGAEAGARYFTDPDKLADLDRRFRQAGLERWPPRYQVVVRTESVDTYSLNVEFEFLRILN